MKRSAPWNLFTMSAIVGIWVYGRCIASFAMRISLQNGYHWNMVLEQSPAD